MTDETIHRDDDIRQKVISLFDNDNRQYVKHAKFSFVQTGSFILLWWFFNNFPLSDVGPLLSFVLDISVRLLPILAAICAVVGVVQMGWYARRCWNAKSPSRMGGES